MPFNPLEEDSIEDIVPIESNTNLSSFEDSIVRKLVFLGASYNKQATFLAIAFGVVVAIFFPQKTKVFAHSTKYRFAVFFQKLKQLFQFLKKGDTETKARCDVRPLSPTICSNKLL